MSTSIKHSFSLLKCFCPSLTQQQQCTRRVPCGFLGRKSNQRVHWRLTQVGELGEHQKLGAGSTQRKIGVWGAWALSSSATTGMTTSLWDWVIQLVLSWERAQCTAVAGTGQGHGLDNTGPSQLCCESFKLGLLLIKCLFWSSLQQGWAAVLSPCSALVVRVPLLELNELHPAWYLWANSTQKALGSHTQGQNLLQNTRGWFFPQCSACKWKHKAIHLNLQFPRTRVWTWMCGHEMSLKLDLPNLQLSLISKHPWEWSPGLELLPAESWAVSLSEGSVVLFS